MYKKRSLYIFVVSLTLIFSSNITSLNAAIQTEVTKSYEPTDDAHVDSSEPDFNYKGDYLEIRYWDAFTAIERKRTYLAFSTDLPENITMTSMVLELEVFLFPGHSVPILIWTTNSFNEDTLTYNNAPEIELLIATPTINENKRWDIQLDLSQLTLEDNYFFVITTTLDDIWGISFYSKDNPFNNAPKLIVTYDDPNYVDPSSMTKNLVLLIIIAGIGVFIFLVYRTRKSSSNKNLPLQALFPEKAIEMFCSNCGAKRLNSTSPFCAECGGKF